MSSFNNEWKVSEPKYKPDTTAPVALHKSNMYNR